MGMKERWFKNTLLVQITRLGNENSGHDMTMLNYMVQTCQAYCIFKKTFSPFPFIMHLPLSSTVPLLHN